MTSRQLWISDTHDASFEYEIDAVGDRTILAATVNGKDKSGLPQPALRGILDAVEDDNREVGGNARKYGPQGGGQANPRA